MCRLDESRYTESRVFAGVGEGEKEECLLFDRKFIFLKPDESILELGSGDDCTYL